VSQQLEIGFINQVSDIRLLAGKKVVKTDHIMAIRNQPLTQMRPKKTSATGD
jgi:hypothetical protein